MEGDTVWAIPCIWGNDEAPSPGSDDGIDYDDDEAMDAWLDTQPQIYPELIGAYNGQWDSVKKNVSLNGQNLQVIVKLANIVLTPEKPEYTGGRLVSSSFDFSTSR